MKLCILAQTCMAPGKRWLQTSPYRHFIQITIISINSPTSTYVTIFGKINHLRASTEIHFLPVQEGYIHVLSKNTNCLTIDGQVSFYRRLFTDAVKLQGCISWSWGALIGLHGVPNCSSRQSWPPLWIVSVHVTY